MGLANLVAFVGEGRTPETPGTSVVLASDLHANALVLPVLESYTTGKTVFLAGDFTLRGTRPESRLVPLIRNLAQTVVAVSGNHDSRLFMVDLARAAVIVLTRDGRLLPDGSTDGRPIVEVEATATPGALTRVHMCPACYSGRVKPKRVADGCLGGPVSKLITSLASRASARRSSVATLVRCWPDSMREMAEWLVPMRSASCSCVSPSSALR